MNDIAEKRKQYENKIKADAVMDLANTVVGAYEAGFVDRANCTLAELYEVARNYCTDIYGIEPPGIVDVWGEDLAKECGFGKAS